MEKKVAGGNIAIALGILCIVFVIGLAGTIVSYTSVINSKDATHQDYVSTHTHSNDEFNNYGSQITSLQNQVNSLDSRMTSLQAQYDSYVADHHHTDQEFDSVTAPNLIAVNLKASDLGAGLPLVGTPDLHVYGYVCNVGAYASYNSRIHVIAYQSGGVVAIDTYITLGTVYGQSWKAVDSTFTYSGDALLSWTTTPTWTTNP
jgi:hypothetical protein